MVLTLFLLKNASTLGSNEDASELVQMNLQEWTEEEAPREGGERASETSVPGPIGGPGGVVSRATPAGKSCVKG